MDNKRCAFADFKNICHYKYKGYRCIYEDCDVYGKYMVRQNECVYLRDERCIKLNILGCIGKDKCIYFTEFLSDPSNFNAERKDQK
jgi:hypothetical protein